MKTMANQNRHYSDTFGVGSIKSILYVYIYIYIYISQKNDKRLMMELQNA